MHEACITSAIRASSLYELFDRCSTLCLKFDAPAEQVAYWNYSALSFGP